jgi:hypothetical protein
MWETLITTTDSRKRDENLPRYRSSGDAKTAREGVTSEARQLGLGRFRRRIVNTQTRVWAGAACWPRIRGLPQSQSRHPRDLPARPMLMNARDRFAAAAVRERGEEINSGRPLSGAAWKVPYRQIVCTARPGPLVDHALLVGKFDIRGAAVFTAAPVH